MISPHWSAKLHWVLCIAHHSSWWASIRRSGERDTRTHCSFRMAARSVRLASLCKRASHCWVPRADSGSDWETPHDKCLATCQRDSRKGKSEFNKYIPTIRHLVCLQRLRTIRCIPGGRCAARVQILTVQDGWTTLDGPNCAPAASFHRRLKCQE